MAEPCDKAESRSFAHSVPVEETLVYVLVYTDERMNVLEESGTFEDVGEVWCPECGFVLRSECFVCNGHGKLRAFAYPKTGEDRGF